MENSTKYLLIENVRYQASYYIYKIFDWKGLMFIVLSSKCSLYNIIVCDNKSVF